MNILFLFYIFTFSISLFSLFLICSSLCAEGFGLTVTQVRWLCNKTFYGTCSFWRLAWLCPRTAFPNFWTNPRRDTAQTIWSPTDEYFPEGLAVVFFSARAGWGRGFLKKEKWRWRTCFLFLFGSILKVNPWFCPNLKEVSRSKLWSFFSRTRSALVGSMVYILFLHVCLCGSPLFPRALNSLRNQIQQGTRYKGSIPHMHVMRFSQPPPPDRHKKLFAPTDPVACPSVGKSRAGHSEARARQPCEEGG